MQITRPGEEISVKIAVILAKEQDGYFLRVCQNRNDQ